MSAVVIPRIRRLPSFRTGAIEKRRREIAVYRASRKLAEAARRAAKRGGMPQGPERDDEVPQARADPWKVAEILAPFRPEFEGMDPGEHEQFLGSIRLFAARRIRLREWLAVVRASRLRYEASLPRHEPPGRAIKAKDHLGVPPQGW
jgi:hypothetical protein